ncbi:putative Se/S carrier-like protein [uncultured Veillonella sp.]|uniref:putative Se/S carrier-like protein n=1 Tax=uncultured Veillonella sp. TaxID=159268 RepID=UPI0025DC34F4|nr:putative Se/S carrier-like protein [uncultured Veillonella sp.]
MNTLNTLILFTDYYFATKAESLLLEKSIAHSLIPTPLALQNTCGLCILLTCSGESETDGTLSPSLVEVLELFKKAHISHSGLYAYDKKRQICEKINIPVCK